MDQLIEFTTWCVGVARNLRPSPYTPNPTYRTPQVVKMAERLCGGRVVSVVERHCVAAQADTNADPGGAPQPATSAAGMGGPEEGGSRDAAGRDGSDVMETRGGGGSEDGAGEGLKPPLGENRHQTGDQQKGKGAPHDDDGGASSELECLKGHIRGLRAGCVGPRAGGVRCVCVV